MPLPRAVDAAKYTAHFRDLLRCIDGRAPGSFYKVAALAYSSEARLMLASHRLGYFSSTVRYTAGSLYLRLGVVAVFLARADNSATDLHRCRAAYATARPIGLRGNCDVEARTNGRRKYDCSARRAVARPPPRARLTWRKLKPKFHYADFGVMESGLKGTSRRSRVCRGRHGKVGTVEFGLKQVGRG